MTCIFCCQMEGGEPGRECLESEASPFLPALPAALLLLGDDFREGPGSAGPNLPVLASHRRAWPHGISTVPPRSRMQGKGSNSPLSAGKKTQTPNPTAAPGFPRLPAGLTHPAEPPLSLPKPPVLGILPSLSQPPCYCPTSSVPTSRRGLQGLPPRPSSLPGAPAAGGAAGGWKAAPAHRPPGSLGTLSAGQHPACP